MIGNSILLQYIKKRSHCIGQGSPYTYQSSQQRSQTHPVCTAFLSCLLPLVLAVRFRIGCLGYCKNWMIGIVVKLARYIAEYFHVPSSASSGSFLYAFVGFGGLVFIVVAELANRFVGPGWFCCFLPLSRSSCLSFWFGCRIMSWL